MSHVTSTDHRILDLAAGGPRWYHHDLLRTHGGTSDPGLRAFVIVRSSVVDENMPDLVDDNSDGEMPELVADEIAAPAGLRRPDATAHFRGPCSGPCRSPVEGFAKQGRQG